MTTDPAEMIRRLRAQVLSVEPGELEITPTEARPRVWGVLMEIGYTLGIATLVTLSEGTTSLYFSNGGGIIGAGEHVSVRAAADAFLTSVETHLAAFTIAETTPPPRIGRVRFYVRTFGPTLTGEADDQDLSQNRHQLSPVYHAGHAVMTEIRNASERGDIR